MVWFSFLKRATNARRVPITVNWRRWDERRQQRTKKENLYRWSHCVIGFCSVHRRAEATKDAKARSWVALCFLFFIARHKTKWKECKKASTTEKSEDSHCEAKESSRRSELNWALSWQCCCGNELFNVFTFSRRQLNSVRSFNYFCEIVIWFIGLFSVWMWVALGLCGCAVNRDLSSKQLVAGDCQFFDIPLLLFFSTFHIRFCVILCRGHVYDERSNEMMTLVLCDRTYPHNQKDEKTSMANQIKNEWTEWILTGIVRNSHLLFFRSVPFVIAYALRHWRYLNIVWNGFLCDNFIIVCHQVNFPSQLSVSRCRLDFVRHKNKNAFDFRSLWICSEWMELVLCKKKRKNSI